MATELDTFTEELEIDEFEEETSSQRQFSWGLIVGMLFSLTGLIASLIIIIEKMNLLENPDYITSCSLNPILSCSGVMQSWQAGVFFGFPNPLIGIMGFTALLAFFTLSTFVDFPKWLKMIPTIGSGLALIFCFWLATQATFFIGAVCLYCVGVWISTTIIFWISLRPHLKESFKSWTWVACILTLTAFATILFFGFSDFWLSLF